MTVGQRCAMGVDPSVAANPFGTGGTGGPMGGWTVHLPSPLGEEKESPSLTLTLTPNP